MRQSKWTGYDRYLVLSDKSNNKLGSTFDRYLNFKKVMEIINNIAFTDKTTYLCDGNIYERKITTTDAKNILESVDSGNWHSRLNGLFLVANQLKLRI
tara:strand:- start:113 stop:406 length:294 start_codon:yes stop_codon:yes gene_type:complete